MTGLGPMPLGGDSEQAGEYTSRGPAGGVSASSGGCEGVNAPGLRTYPANASPLDWWEDY